MKERIVNPGGLQALSEQIGNYIDNGHSKYITSSTDINSVTTPGRYYMPGQSPNAPFEGYMDVFAYDSNYVKQVAYSAERANEKMVFRTKQNGIWSAWNEVALNEQIAKQDFTSLVTQDKSWQWISCTKVGNVCYITGRLSYVEIGTTETKVLTIPSGYNPAYNVCAPSVALDGSGANAATYGTCRINSNGEMIVRNNANGYYNNITVSYVV